MCDGCLFLPGPEDAVDLGLTPTLPILYGHESTAYLSGRLCI